MTYSSASLPVLVLGARSDIGMAVGRHYASLGHPVQLAARNVTTLEPDRADIALRSGVEVSLHEFDILDTDGHAAFLDSLPALPGIVVCAVGVMGDEAQSASDPVAAQRVMRSNYEGPVLILGALAERFVARGNGTIVGISSVAGDRGRASNGMYGAAKAGFTAWLSAARNRLVKQGVHVVTVKPGFVDTAMTADLDLPGPLTADPDSVARAIVRAVEKGGNVIYTKPVWRLIMWIIRALPEPVFKKLSI